MNKQQISKVYSECESDKQIFISRNESSILTFQTNHQQSNDVNDLRVYRACVSTFAKERSHLYRAYRAYRAM